MPKNKIYFVTIPILLLLIGFVGFLFWRISSTPKTTDINSAQNTNQSEQITNSKFPVSDTINQESTLANPNNTLNNTTNNIVQTNSTNNTTNSDYRYSADLYQIGKFSNGDTPLLVPGETVINEPFATSLREFYESMKITDSGLEEGDSEINLNFIQKNDGKMIFLNTSEIWFMDDFKYQNQEYWIYALRNLDQSSTLLISRPDFNDARTIPGFSNVFVANIKSAGEQDTGNYTFDLINENTNENKTQTLNMNEIINKLSEVQGRE